MELVAGDQRTVFVDTFSNVWNLLDSEKLNFWLRLFRLWIPMLREFSSIRESTIRSGVNSDLGESRAYTCGNRSGVYARSYQCDGEEIRPSNCPVHRHAGDLEDVCNLLDSEHRVLSYGFILLLPFFSLLAARIGPARRFSRREDNCAQ
jgi:hypothetical protein